MYNVPFGLDGIFPLANSTVDATVGKQILSPVFTILHLLVLFLLKEHGGRPLPHRPPWGSSFLNFFFTVLPVPIHRRMGIGSPSTDEGHSSGTCYPWSLCDTAYMAVSMCGEEKTTRTTYSTALALRTP